MTEVGKKPKEEDQNQLNAQNALFINSLACDKSLQLIGQESRRSNQGNSIPRKDDSRNVLKITASKQSTQSI